MTKEIEFTTSKGGTFFTTHAVDAEQPYLLKPDVRYSADGDYKCNFTVENSDYWREIIEKGEEIIKEFAAKLKAEGKKSLRMSPDLPWTENDDNTITFKTKIKAKYLSWTPEVVQFDAAGKLLEEKVNIGPGSRIKLNLELRPWESSNKVGISIRPHAVQILKLRTGGSKGDAASFGFGKEAGYSIAPGLSTPNH